MRKGATNYHMPPSLALELLTTLLFGPVDQLPYAPGESYCFRKIQKLLHVVQKKASFLWCSFWSVQVIGQAPVVDCVGM